MIQWATCLSALKCLRYQISPLQETTRSPASRLRFSQFKETSRKLWTSLLSVCYFVSNPEIFKSVLTQLPGISFFLLHPSLLDKKDLIQFLSRKKGTRSGFVTEVIAVSTNPSDIGESVQSLREQLQQLFLVALLLTVCGLVGLLLLNWCYSQQQQSHWRRPAAINASDSQMRTDYSASIRMISVNGSTVHPFLSQPFVFPPFIVLVTFLYYLLINNQHTVLAFEVWVRLACFCQEDICWGKVIWSG